MKNLGRSKRVALSAQADSVAAGARVLIASSAAQSGTAWFEEVAAAVAFRPAAWRDINSGDAGPVHPVELGRAVQEALEWRVIRMRCSSPTAAKSASGRRPASAAPARASSTVPGGSIGSGVPFALSLRAWRRPKAPVVAVMGDGAFGFHLMEFDTAVR